MSRKFVFCTERQFEVLLELAKDGADNRMIARRLHLAEDTVKSHLKVVYLKSGAKSRTELVVGLLRGTLAVVPPGSGAAHDF